MKENQFAWVWSFFLLFWTSNRLANQVHAGTSVKVCIRTTINAASVFPKIFRQFGEHTCVMSVLLLIHANSFPIVCFTLHLQYVNCNQFVHVNVLHATHMSTEHRQLHSVFHIICACEMKKIPNQNVHPVWRETNINSLHWHYQTSWTQKFPTEACVRDFFFVYDLADNNRILVYAASSFITLDFPALCSNIFVLKPK